MIGLSVASCAGLTGVGGGDNEATQTVSPAAGVLTDADQCRIALQAQPTAATRSLDQTRMRLLNWNTQKNTDTNMQADLTRLAEGVDLILLQESVRDSAAFARPFPHYTRTSS